MIFVVVIYISVTGIIVATTLSFLWLFCVYFGVLLASIVSAWRLCCETGVSFFRPMLGLH